MAGHPYDEAEPIETAEATEADLAEQSAEIGGQDAELDGVPGGGQLEVDPADAAEQAVPVPVDEDEYR